MTSQPTQAPPQPWAFAAYYDKPLPQHLQFHHATGFGDMARAIQTLHENQAPDAAVRVNPKVMAYKDGEVKKWWTQEDPGLTQAQRDDLKRGATISDARKGFVSSGSIGVVVSNMTNAAEFSASGDTDWHAVAVARQGKQLWIHDPAFVAADHKGNVNRMDAVRGTSNVRALARELNVTTATPPLFQGPTADYAQGPAELECMGRSVQWIEAVVDGTLPWPPNQDATGGQWTQFLVN